MQRNHYGNIYRVSEKCMTKMNLQPEQLHDANVLINIQLTLKLISNKVGCSSGMKTVNAISTTSAIAMNISIVSSFKQFFNN